MLTVLSKNKDQKMCSFTKGITEEFVCLLHSSMAASQMVSQVVWLNLKVLHIAPQLFLQSCFVRPLLHSRFSEERAKMQNMLWGLWACQSGVGSLQCAPEGFQQLTESTLR